MSRLIGIKKYLLNYYTILFFFAIFLRVFFHLFSPIEFFPDSFSYLHLSNIIFTSTKIEDHLSMPGYPIFLFLSNKIFGNYFALDILTSSVLVLVMSRLYFKIFNDEYGAKICALLFAIYPFNILYSSLMLAENSFIFFAITGYTFLYYKNIFFGFLFIIISIMIRPAIDLFNILIVIVFSILIFKENYKDLIKKIIIFIIFYCTIHTPWWIYNYDRYGQFVKSNLSTGMALYSGNNELNKTGGGILWKDFTFDVIEGVDDPIKQNEIMKNEAIKFIINNPERFFELTLKRFVRFFNIIPNTNINELYGASLTNLFIILISGISMTSLYLLSFFALTKISKEKLIKLSPLFIYFIILTGIHMITIASIRYRFPLEFILILLSSFSISIYFKKFILLFKLK